MLLAIVGYNWHNFSFCAVLHTTQLPRTRHPHGKENTDVSYCLSSRYAKPQLNFHVFSHLRLDVADASPEPSAPLPLPSYTPPPRPLPPPATVLDPAVNDDTPSRQELMCTCGNHVERAVQRQKGGTMNSSAQIYRTERVAPLPAEHHGRDPQRAERCCGNNFASRLFAQEDISRPRPTSTSKSKRKTCTNRPTESPISLLAEKGWVCVCV